MLRVKVDERGHLKIYSGLSGVSGVKIDLHLAKK